MKQEVEDLMILMKYKDQAALRENDPDERDTHQSEQDTHSQSRPLPPTARQYAGEL